MTLETDELEKIGNNAKLAAEDFDFAHLSEKLANVIEETISNYQKGETNKNSSNRVRIYWSTNISSNGR